jgi:Cytochrome C oxidase, cbb3-type, subunit III
MKISFATALALLLGSATAFADGLTADDYQYLQTNLGLTAKSAVIVELTPNEQNALHSAIFDLRSYPEGQDRQVRSYLSLAYGRECKRWAEKNPGQNCSPAADPAIQPGKAISDRVCADCHLFGTQSAASFRKMANQKTWDPHKVEHALHHNPGMVPIRLTAAQLDALAAYINAFKVGP